ncbi:universal stress protein [Marixanthomonas spongiae]|uniref:Universal stress protein n=1 Tax=Marixanthomonas spongiae TaxID=2174845 RepID=A0A2U0I441_9FLAO|nr:universal stress protein [Marixanthomonas spongiae]PVW15877.1 universal stress protein [Marixanthomonas spongiae]
MNVLIPTDFSDNAWNAKVYAVSLLKKQWVTFHLVHVKDFVSVETGPEIHGSGVLFTAPNKATAKTQLLKLQERITAHQVGANHRFETAIEHGSFIKGIRSQVAEHRIDLIIMGTKGASGIKKYTLGSNTGDVITKVKCPVLVIPEQAVYEVPKDIAFPTDFNLLYKKRIIATLKTALKLHHSFLHIVQMGSNTLPINDIQAKNKDFLAHSLGNIQHDFHSCNSTNMEEAIQQFVDKKQINMIAMVAKNLNFFQRILFKPSAKTISYHTKIPFLVLHE